MTNTLLQFNNGDQAAFRTIYDMFYQALCSYGCKIVGDTDLASDMVQEVFISLWCKREEFTSIDSVRYFLYAALKNRSLNHIKHTKIVEKHQGGVATQEQDKEADYLDLIILEEVHRQLREAIAELPESYRKVIVLSLKDKQNQEIANILGLSVNTVRNQKQKGYAILRKRIGDSSYLIFVFF